MLYDLLIGSFSKAFLAAASASSYVAYPFCASGFSSSGFSGVSASTGDNT